MFPQNNANIGALGNQSTFGDAPPKKSLPVKKAKKKGTVPFNRNNPTQGAK